MFEALPPFATFTHTGARDGFEAVCFRAGSAAQLHSGPAPGRAGEEQGRPYLLEGGTAALEDDVPWSVRYRVAVDPLWRTTYVESTGDSPSGHHAMVAEVRDGRWWVDGVERADLDGCVDIDFESSLVTNTLAVHRLDLESRTPVDVPAAFVRADDLRVERLEQSYLFVGRDGARMLFDYTSTTFDVACRLVLDSAGVVVDYPGLGHRHR